ncbi:MAG: hypothetical protein EAZ34_00840, partial [Polaromonas sp.]
TITITINAALHNHHFTGQPPRPEKLPRYTGVVKISTGWLMANRQTFADSRLNVQVQARQKATQSATALKMAACWCQR